MIDDAELDELAAWLWREGGVAAVDELVAAAHPVRAWLDGEVTSAARFRDLVAVLARGGHLPLLAALALRTGKPVPPGVARALAGALAWWDQEVHRARGLGGDVPDVFLCYAHEDAARVERIVRALRNCDLTVFRDTESIPPGHSIAATVAMAIDVCRAAVVVVSAASVASSWVTREVALLMPGRISGARPIFPIVIDDVPIPTTIVDLFAIDLRGLDDVMPDDVVESRLQPFIDEVQRGHRATGMLFQP